MTEPTPLQRPWLDASLPTEKRIDLLLAEMNLEEKVGQMNQLDGGKDFDAGLIRKGLVGSMLNAGGANAGNEAAGAVSAARLNALQRIAVEETRLGVPLIFARDVIHGHRTVFPIPLGQAATWNPCLVRDAAQVTAAEAAADGLHWTFTPMMDVSRDARWGRIAESFGEDPVLASRMAEASVQGFQGDDLSQPGRIAACAKHFVAYGAAEGGRDYWEAHVGERELRDVYLAPFHAAVKAGVATVMSAFHVVDGVPCSGDRRLLTDVLKTEWGFDGIVVSDYGIVSEMHSGHGVAESLRDAAALAANAGLDMDMMSHLYTEHLPGLVADGTVPLAQIDDAVRRVLRIKFRCGLFERPYTDEALAASVMLTEKSKQLARRAVHESAVLLRNDGILPLRPGLAKLLVTGPFTHAQREVFGTWTLDGRGEDVTPLGQAIQAAAPVGMEVRLDSPTAWGDLTPILARGASAAIACVGEAPWRSGEGNSIAELELPTGQQALLEKLHELGVPIVAVVFAGRPLAIRWLAEHAAAILYVWHPGVASGEGIADLLFGTASPSGRLPATMPRTTGQVPLHYAHRATHRPGSFWERNGWYKDTLHTPLYPFGHGLAYTTFAYSDLAVARPELALARDSVGVQPSGCNEITNNAIRIAATVTNTGARPGDEVVQLYVRDVKASVSRPVKELKAFRKVTLAPGESRRVEFELCPGDLAFTGLDGRATVEPGEFRVWVGPNAQEGLEGAFRLT